MYSVRTKKKNYGIHIAAAIELSIVVYIIGTIVTNNDSLLTLIVRYARWPF